MSCSERTNPQSVSTLRDGLNALGIMLVRAPGDPAEEAEVAKNPQIVLLYALRGITNKRHPPSLDILHAACVVVHCTVET